MKIQLKQDVTTGKRLMKIRKTKKIKKKEKVKKSTKTGSNQEKKNENM